MRKVIRYMLLVLLVSFCSNSFAQRYLFTERTVVLPKVLDVSVSAGNTSFNFTQTSNYDTGIEKLNLFTVTIKANVSWKLSVSVPAALLSPQSTITPMPVSIFSLRNLSAGANYNTITYPTPLTSTGTRGTYTLSFDVKANPGYLYEQNTYLTDIYFVITEP
jgi:hypothetical protein